jgi:tetratricopeptide (TPR) repeat protein
VAYSHLGYLYQHKPELVIGVGNERKALKYLQLGLALNSDGVESNYYYALFLYKEKHDYQQAKHFLQIALELNDTKIHPNVLKFIRNEISTCLDTIERKLNK